MQQSRALNLQLLLTELRRLAPQARYDDRLMRRAAQAQLLGPGLSPEEHLGIASGLLALSAWS